MNELIKKIQNVNNDIKSVIDNRLREFKKLGESDGLEWFSELCFCLLTANSKASTALKIQEELGVKGFCSACSMDVKNCIINNRHRFHNNKTKYIVEAREHLDVKEKITSIVESSGEAGAREWLAKNVKGLGFKEASHFLRNVGFENLAILDRHILWLLAEYGYISEVPKSLNKKTYISIEKVFNGLARELGMSPARLDLFMWYLKTGRVLK